MKKLDLCIPFVLVVAIASCLCTGCGVFGLAGTAEEPNEFTADNPTSSSSPSFVQPEMSSEMVPTPRYSSGGELSGPNEFESSLKERYLAQFGIGTLRFDRGVLSARATQSCISSSQACDPDVETEFEGPWPHRLDERNIGTVEKFFPEAAGEYADLVDAVRDGSASDDCGLYVMAVDSDSRFAAFVLAGIAKDTVTVFDIAAPNCKEAAEYTEIGFLFRYCGEIDERPEIVHKTVDVDMPADKCPDLQSEWVLKR